MAAEVFDVALDGLASDAEVARHRRSTVEGSSADAAVDLQQAHVAALEVAGNVVLIK